MKMRILVAPSLAAALVFSAAGCGEDDDANVNGSGGGGNSEYDVTDRETWYGCDIFDDQKEMIEFLGVEETDSGLGDGEALLSTTVGEGINGQAAGCTADAVYATYEISESTEGEISGGITTSVAPMDDIDDAQEWHDYGVTEMYETYIVDFEYDQFSLEGDWDEGEYFYYIGSGSDQYDILLRDANLLISARIVHDHEPDDVDALDFTKDEVEDWLTNTYAPYIHQAASDFISEEN